MTQYLGYEDELSVSRLLSTARRYGATGVDVMNSCGDTKHFYYDNRPDEMEDSVLEWLDGGDMDYTFAFYRGDSENEQHLGTFYVCLGNDDGSAVYDSSCQNWCEKVWKELD